MRNSKTFEFINNILNESEESNKKVKAKVLIDMYNFEDSTIKEVITRLEQDYGLKFISKQKGPESGTYLLTVIGNIGDMESLVMGDTGSMPWNDVNELIENGIITIINESEKLNEKRNPENDEANELIRTSLNDPEYAKNHATELRKHGIKYIPPEEGKEWKGGALEGKQGRRLAVNVDRYGAFKDRVDRVTQPSYSNDAYLTGYSSDDSYADERDLRQKTYVKSREDDNRARKNIDRQRTRVRNLENKDHFDSQVLKARDTLQNYEDTLQRGISADYKDTRKIHPDTDLKGFLNAKRHSDRPLSRENDPEYGRHRGVTADPANKDLEDYKWAKSERKYLDKERERIDQSNKEDQDRIKEMRKRFAEDKARREKGYKAQEKDWKDIDSKIQNKLDNYRKRMGNK